MIKNKIVVCGMLTLLMISMPNVDARGFKQSEVAGIALGSGIVVGGGLYLAQRFGYLESIKNYLAEKYADNPTMQKRILYGGIAGVSAAVATIAGFCAYTNTPGYVQWRANAHYNTCKKKYNDVLSADTNVKGLIEKPELAYINVLLDRPAQLDLFMEQLKTCDVARLKSDVIKLRKSAMGVVVVDEAFITQLNTFADKFADVKDAVEKITALKKVKDGLEQLNKYDNIFGLLSKNLVNVSPGSIRAITGSATYPYHAMDERLREVSGLLAEIEKEIGRVKARREGSSLGALQALLDQQVEEQEQNLAQKQDAFTRIQNTFSTTCSAMLQEERRMQQEDKEFELKKIRAQAALLTARGSDKTGDGISKLGDARNKEANTKRGIALLNSAERVFDRLGGRSPSTSSNRKRRKSSD